MSTQAMVHCGNTKGSCPMTVKTVADGNKMDNESLGALTRRFREIERRVNEGTLGFEGVMQRLQDIVEWKGMIFPIWKTITLGLHTTADDYRKAMKLAKNKISECANHTLDRAEFTCATQETDVDLVTLSVADLGFKSRAKYGDICTRALKLGLELCPAEVGPALRIAYKEQPRGEWLMVAMEAITDLDDDAVVFHVENDGHGLWLGGYGNPDDLSNSARFVLVRPKQPQ